MQVNAGRMNQAVLDDCFNVVNSRIISLEARMYGTPRRLPGSDSSSPEPHEDDQPTLHSFFPLKPNLPPKVCQTPFPSTEQFLTM